MTCPFLETKKPVPEAAGIISLSFGNFLLDLGFCATLFSPELYHSHSLKALSCAEEALVPDPL